MKKILPFISLLIAFGHSGYSQVRFGVKEGLSLSKIHFNSLYSNDQKFRVGLNVGVLSEIVISKKFFIRPELLYSQKGYSIGNDYSGSNTEKFNYLTLPVLVGYRPSEKVSILLGP